MNSARARARGAPRAAIEEAVSLLARTIDDSRSLVFALSPPVLYDLGLAAAISWLADDLQAKHRLEVKRGGRHGKPPRRDHRGGGVP